MKWGGGGQIGLSASGIFILREKWWGGERPFRSLVSYLQRQASSRPVGHNTDIAIIGLGYRLQLQVQARSVCLASGGPRQGRERHRSTQQYVGLYKLQYYNANGNANGW